MVNTILNTELDSNAAYYHVLVRNALHSNPQSIRAELLESTSN